MHPVLEDLDWLETEQAAVELLCELLRFDTTNPPGAEEACAQFVAGHLRDSGLEPRVLSAAPGRSNVVARVAGTGVQPPLLLTAHLDVVPADAERWTHGPFAGTVADGQVWGRGAVDMKNMAAMCLTVLRLLVASGITPNRDVLFAGVADEEAGCDRGSAWLVEHHPDAVRAGYSLGELGGFTLHVGGRALYPIQVAEKGLCWIRARATGTAGHGSVPRRDNAVVRLADFVARAGRARLPLHPSPAMQRFVRGIADTQQGALGRALPLLLRPRLSGLLTSYGIRDEAIARQFDALLRNSVSPTLLRGGSKINVIPGTAEAELDGRVAVGSSAEELLAELRAVLPRSLRRDVALEVVRSRAPHEAPVDTPLFTTLADVVADHHPGAVAVPSVIPGFTDAHYFSTLGAVCYGFAPVRLRPEDPTFAELFHADDERIPVAGFTAGLRMLADAVFRFVTD